MSEKRTPRWPLWLGICVFIVFLGGAFADGCPWCVLPSRDDPDQTAADAGELIRGAPLNPTEETRTDGDVRDRPVRLDDTTNPVDLSTEPLPEPAQKPETGPEAAQPEPRADDEGRYRSVAWEKLAGFTYEYPSGDLKDPKNLEGRKPYPEDVMALNGKDCAVTGFMVPVDVEGEKVLTFYLVRTPFSCCYGQPPQMNEYIYVVMNKGKPAGYKSHAPITVYGKLAVEEEIENGAVLSLYQIAGEDAATPVGVR